MLKTAKLLVLVTLVFGGIVHGQSSNATVTGFVQDTSQANVPGVTVTATNTQTGISATTLSNDSGSYTIQSLLPGTYKLTAALTGFRTQTINDVTLGASITARYNFKLEVGQMNQETRQAFAQRIRSRLSPADRVVVQAPNRGDAAPVVGEDVTVNWHRDAGMVFAQKPN